MTDEPIPEAASETPAPQPDSIPEPTAPEPPPVIEAIVPPKPAKAKPIMPDPMPVADAAPEPTPASVLGMTEDDYKVKLATFAALQQAGVPRRLVTRMKDNDAARILGGEKYDRRKHMPTQLVLNVPIKLR